MTSSAYPAMNPWEQHSLNYEFPEDDIESSDGQVWRQLQDPIIYPGLYSATGFDVMDILFRIMSRPNPSIDLGPVDCSVALTICDLSLPDQPIVYASESFCELTGYSNAEVIGRKFRFLQSCDKSSKSLKSSKSSKSSQSSDRIARQQLRQALQNSQEIQIQLTNYRKNGQPFTNMLSVIPISLDYPQHHYAVGFHFEMN